MFFTMVGESDGEIAGSVWVTRDSVWDRLGVWAVREKVMGAIGVWVDREVVGSIG